MKSNSPVSTLTYNNLTLTIENGALYGQLNYYGSISEKRLIAEHADGILDARAVYGNVVYIRFIDIDVIVTKQIQMCFNHWEVNHIVSHIPAVHASSAPIPALA